MTEIWFIRHGESASNAGGRTEAVGTIRLTPTGHEQSNAIAALLPRAPDLIVMSPFIRTQETAAPTIARFPNASQEIWPIQEFSYLDAEKYKNTTVEERRPFAAAYWEKDDPDYKDSAGSESFADMVGRVRDMVDRLQKTDHEFVVVFCHGLVLHTLEILMAEPDLPLRDVMKKLNHVRLHAHMPNTHIIKAELDADKKLILKTPPKKVPPCPNPAPK